MKRTSLHQVDAFIKQYTLLHHGATVIAAVSGGPDSLAMLHYLMQQRESYGLQVIAAHVDHMFRGQESEEDMLYVQEICRQWEIRCETVRIDVAAYAKEHKLGGQAAARECRYAYLEKVMEKHQADYLVLGHHGDDQVETILMRLVRGSTMQGYAGMAAKRPFGTGYMVRPFLAVGRQMIEQYCEEMDIIPRLDPSNMKDVYTRNRFRKYILPQLKRENPQVHERFWQFSKFLQEDEQYLQELAHEKMNKVVKKKDRNKIVLSAEEFECLPMPLQRRGIQLILNYLYEHRLPSSLSSIHIDQVLQFMKRSHPSGSLDLPEGLQVRRAYGECQLGFWNETNIPFSYILPVPGTVALPNGDELTAEIASSFPHTYDAAMFIGDMRFIHTPFTIRSRQDGDRMTVQGMNGSKKLKAIFIEAKVPQQMRGSWPVVCDAEGTIVWLPLLKRSQQAVTAQEAGEGSYILIRYKSKESSRRMDN